MAITPKSIFDTIKKKEQIEIFKACEAMEQAIDFWLLRGQFESLGDSQIIVSLTQQFGHPFRFASVFNDLESCGPIVEVEAELQERYLAQGWIKLELEEVTPFVKNGGAGEWKVTLTYPPIE